MIWLACKNSAPEWGKPTIDCNKSYMIILYKCQCLMAAGPFSDFFCLNVCEHLSTLYLNTHLCFCCAKAGDVLVQQNGVLWRKTQILWWGERLSQAKIKPWTLSLHAWKMWQRDWGAADSCMALFVLLQWFFFFTCDLLKWSYVCLQPLAYATEWRAVWLKSNFPSQM